VDRDDIIKMAKEAGIEFYPSPTNDVRFCLFKNLERFATLVAAAVAEPEQEPVAWANESDLPNFDMKVRTGPDLHHTVPLYTAPPKKEWVGLTVLEVYECWKTGDVVEAVEAKLKEKNA